MTTAGGGVYSDSIGCKVVYRIFAFGRFGELLALGGDTGVTSLSPVRLIIHRVLGRSICSHNPSRKLQVYISSGDSVCAHSYHRSTLEIFDGNVVF